MRRRSRPTLRGAAGDRPDHAAAARRQLEECRRQLFGRAAHQRRPSRPHPPVRRRLRDRGGRACRPDVRATWSSGRRPTCPSAPISSFLPEAASAASRRRWLYFKLWPNVAFDIYPDQVDFMHFVPVGPTETMIREISYALPDGAPRDEGGALPQLADQPPGQCRGHGADPPRPAGHGARRSTGRGRSARARSACGASRASSGGSFRRRGWTGRRRRAGARARV